MSSDKPSIYCFDSSAFIIMHRYYPYLLMPALWELLDNLVVAGRLISHEIVYSEIVPLKGEQDFLAKWFVDNRKIFITQSQNQIDKVRDILRNFPKLINPDYEKDQADPWLIASLNEIMEKQGLFGEDSSYCLVSMENTRSPQKLPAACIHYSIRHMTLFEFFADNNLKFNIVGQ